MGGRIQNDFNAAQVAQQLSDLGFNAQVVPAKVNIGEALNNSGARQTQGANKPNIVSKENYTYKDVQGTLIKYDDGSIIFQAKRQVNGKEVPYQFKFNNENDLKNGRPSAEILNPGDAKKRLVTNFEYQRNGKLKNVEVRNAQNVVIKQEEFNKDGKLEKRKLYDKKGELTKTVEFKRNKDNSVESRVYDKDHKLEYTALTKYAQDGKTAIGRTDKYPGGELKAEFTYDDKGKIKNATEYFESGKVKAQTEYWDNGVIKEQEQFDENGKVTSKISAEIDGNFGLSRQVGEGDCYLMATINSIRELDNGQEMLKDLVKVETNANGEKVYTVTFPGAKVAAEGLRTDKNVDPNKMYITGTYTFTESEMEEILKQAGHGYSLGDGDVILLEAAFEKYRKEVAQTLAENPGLKKERGIAGAYTGRSNGNILAGGFGEDATFILTGRTSRVYDDSNVANGLDYTALTTTGDLKVVSRKKQNGNLVKAGVSEVEGGFTKDQRELNKMLDDIMNDPKDGKKDLMASAGFRTIHDDGTESGHQLTIKSVTEDTVVLVNPWNPEKEVTMSREDFLNSCTTLNVADSSKSAMKPEDVNNPARPQNNGNANDPVQPNSPDKPNSPSNPDQPNRPNNPDGTNPAVQPEQAQTTHKVKRGESLWKIAKQILGPGAKNSKIADMVQKLIKANPQIKNPNLIRVGETINIPS